MTNKKKIIITSLIFIVVVFLLLFSLIFFLHKKTDQEEQRQQKTIAVQEKEKKNQGEKVNQEKAQLRDADKKRKEDILQAGQDAADHAAENSAEDAAKIASVTIEYEPADDTSATEILKAKEDKLKIFIAEKSSGNGVRENGQGNYPAISTKIKTVSDGGGYITFMCELKGADVPMIYYKDTQQFAFQPADSAPGRTNGYQVLTEEDLTN